MAMKTTHLKGKPKTNVETLIVRLEAERDFAYLCTVGLERLEWWKANKDKFSTISEGIKGWTNDQRDAFFHWVGLKRSAIINIDQALQYATGINKELLQIVRKNMLVPTEEQIMSRVDQNQRFCVSGQFRRHFKPSSGRPVK